MRIGIRNAKDFYSGALFTGVAAAFGLVGQRYQIGSAVEMGPGYFPVMTAAALAIVGVALMARGLALAEGGGAKEGSPFAWRPLLLINGAAVTFAVAIGWLGIVITAIATVFIAARAGWEFRWREVAVLALVCAAVSAGLFVFGLGLPLPLWPKRF
jgi:hypothetical protein